MSSGRRGRTVAISSSSSDDETNLDEAEELQKTPSSRTSQSLDDSVLSGNIRSAGSIKENSQNSLPEKNNTSIVCSTPRNSSMKNASFFPTSRSRIPEFDHITLFDSSEGGIAADIDRSRSFLEDEKDKDQPFTPISKKLSQGSDQSSKQKLRERLLRKKIARNKNFHGQDDAEPRDRFLRSCSNDDLVNDVNLKLSPIARTPDSEHSDVNDCNVSNERHHVSDHVHQGSGEIEASMKSLSGCSSSKESLPKMETDSRSRCSFASYRESASEIIELSSDEEKSADIEDESESELLEDENTDNTDTEFHSNEKYLSDSSLGKGSVTGHKDEWSQEDLKDYFPECQEKSIIVLDDDDEGQSTGSYVPEEEGASIICIGNDESSVEAKENRLPELELPERLRNMLNSSISDLREMIATAQKALSSCSANLLSDGGARLKRRIQDLDQVIAYKEHLQKLSHDVDNTLRGKLECGEAVRLPNSPETKVSLQFQDAVRVIPVEFNSEQYNRLLRAEPKKLFGGKMTEDRWDRVIRVTEKALNSLHKALSTMPDDTQIIDTPKGLRVDLMPHQKQGLAWLMWREAQNPPCGILADDMGLGKTLSMISLIIHQKNERRARKESGNDEIDLKKAEAARSNGLVPSHCTLVVAPASLIYQWESEIEKRVNPDQLKVHVFHGPKNKRESNPKRLARYDVVITTYTLLGTELTEKITTVYKGDSDDDDREGRKKMVADSSSVLAKIAWERIVLDEAHQIKNKNTAASKAASYVPGTARWCLTGTPIHNKLWDLYSLIRFMRVAPFDEEKHWKDYIMSNGQKAADRLNLLVKNLLLRRTKGQVCSITNKPLIDLPAKQIMEHELELRGPEGKVYDMMFAASRQRVEQMLQNDDSVQFSAKLTRKKANLSEKEVRNPFNFGPRTLSDDGSTFKQMSGMLIMLLRLRQACVHMNLTERAVDMDAFNELGGGCDESGVDVLERTLAELSLDGDEAETSSSRSMKQVFEPDFLSTKVVKLLEIVEDVVQRKEKIVIVSQWVSLLELVESHLRRLHIRFTCINGKVAPVDRQERTDSFNRDGGGDQVMLLSLTAGGVGLNLIGGNHLVMVDLHWNPALEAQACDRIYRMGQKRPVYIHRLITKNTIEQRVVQLQKKKLQLAGSVLDGAASKKMTKLTIADLKFLFDLDNKTKTTFPSLRSQPQPNPPFQHSFKQPYAGIANKF